MGLPVLSCFRKISIVSVSIVFIGNDFQSSLNILNDNQMNVIGYQAQHLAFISQHIVHKQSSLT